MVMVAMHGWIWTNGRLRWRWTTSVHVARSALVRMRRVCLVVLRIGRLWRRHTILPLVRRSNLIPGTTTPIRWNRRFGSWRSTDPIAC
jgi:hypothetical protein